MKKTGAASELKTEAEVALQALTSKQRTRVLARLEGQSIRQIARTEGVSKSSVAESLGSPRMRKALTVLGRHVPVTDQDGRQIDLFSALIESLARTALAAERAVVVGAGYGEQRVEMVRDDRLRFDAAVRLLSMIDAPARRFLPSPSAEIEAERAVTTRAVTTTEGLQLRPGRPPAKTDGVR